METYIDLLEEKEKQAAKVRQNIRALALEMLPMLDELQALSDSAFMALVPRREFSKRATSRLMKRVNAIMTANGCDRETYKVIRKLAKDLQV